jgi:hypothetical protein
LLESDQRQRVAEGPYRGIAAFLDRVHSLPDKKQESVSENAPNHILGNRAYLPIESGDARRGANATRDLQITALLRQLLPAHKRI